MTYFQPSFQLIETIDLSGPIGSVTFSGLDGDEDKEYMLVGRFKEVSGTVGGRVELRPNGLTSNLSSQIVLASVTSVSASVSTALDLVSMVVPNGVGYFITHMLAEASVNKGPRLLRTEANAERAPGFGPPTFFDISGHWNDVATRVTSLVITAPAGFLFGPDSTFSLYGIPK